MKTPIARQGVTDEELPEDEAELLEQAALEAEQDADIVEEDQDPSSDAEKARARRMGWRPESEWDEAKGGRKPPTFLTAKEYLAKVETDLPVLRERNRFLDDTVSKLDTANRQNTQKLTDLETRLEEATGLIKDMHGQSKQAGIRGYEKAKRELEAAQRQAVLDADPDAFDKVKADLAELDAAKPTEVVRTEPAVKKVEPATDPNLPSPEVQTQINAWIAKNDWFNKDPELKAVATAAQARIQAANPGETIAWTLEETAKEVRERYAERFENQRRTAPSTVARPGGADRTDATAKAWAKVPPSDRAIYERQRKMFEAKGEKFTREQFLADYQF